MFKRNDHTIKHNDSSAMNLSCIFTYHEWETSNHGPWISEIRGSQLELPEMSGKHDGDEADEVETTVHYNHRNGEQHLIFRFFTIDYLSTWLVHWILLLFNQCWCRCRSRCRSFFRWPCRSLFRCRCRSWWRWQGVQVSYCHSANEISKVETGIIIIVSYDRKFSDF